jgi:hypothetical protein
VACKRDRGNEWDIQRNARRCEVLIHTERHACDALTCASIYQRVFQLCYDRRTKWFKACAKLLGPMACDTYDHERVP